MKELLWALMTWGQIVSVTDRGVQPRAFIWTESNGMKELGNLGKINTSALSINNRGEGAGSGGGSDDYAQPIFVDVTQRKLCFH